MYWPRSSLRVWRCSRSGLHRLLQLAPGHLSKFARHGGGGEAAAAEVAVSPQEAAPAAPAAWPPGGGEPGPARAPAAVAAPSDPRIATKVKLAKGLFDKDPAKARLILENALKDPDLKPYSDPWRQAVAALSEVNTRVLFTDIPCDDKAEYVVKQGDSLFRIARQHNTTPNMVAKSNKLDPDKPALYPEHVLRIYKGDWNLKVSKANYMLLLYDGERLVKGYRIGIGKQNRTPEGPFIVSSKQKNPAWYPGGKSIAADDPRNPLGTRWLAVTGTDPKTALCKGYGVHGTRSRTASAPSRATAVSACSTARSRNSTTSSPRARPSSSDRSPARRGAPRGHVIPRARRCHNVAHVRARPAKPSPQVWTRWRPWPRRGPRDRSPCPWLWFWACGPG